MSMTRNFILGLGSAAAISFCAPLSAQTTPAAPTAPVASTPQPIDPLLTKDPATLTPGDIKSLQGKFANFGQLARYRGENMGLPAPEAGRVVFFGDSITDAWSHRDKSVPFFPGKPYLNRGIGGQTTPQMLVRFQQDVIALKPAAVLILAGTNDIAGNTGIETPEHIQDNFRSMAQLATANHIKVILASILPVDDYPWRRGLGPVAKVQAMNVWLQQFCQQNGYTYLDYYTALATPEGAMKPGTALDGVHPTPAGYAIMAPLAQAAIDRTLSAQ
jgi:lysophospholipase L1-like esterase